MQIFMQNILTLVRAPDGPALDIPSLEAAIGSIAALGGTSSDPDWLNPEIAVDIPFDGAAPGAVIRALAGELEGIDRAALPSDGRRKKVLVADMDSTMIAIETLDTLAAELGFGDEVIEITARSMNGELDFVESLTQRVALLKGFSAKEAMDAVMAKVVHTSGAERAVKTMAAHGCYCALVSGGFTFTTEVVHAQLGFQTHRANTLEMESDGTFTGALIGEIISRPAKLEILDALLAERGLGRDAGVCIGDGANDLDMLGGAGLGIGFHAKPIVRQEAPVLIDHTDMTTLLYYQGYRAQDFVV